MKCEVEIPSRANNGNPLPCGEPASVYRVSGAIASVDATLCDSHVNIMRNRGYRVELLPTFHEEGTAGTTTTVSGEPGKMNGA